MTPLTVKPGDTLICAVNYGRGLMLGKVARVTPSGQIVMATGARLTPDGRQVGMAGFQSSLYWRVPDADDLARYALQEERNAVFVLGERLISLSEKMTLDQCQRITAALAEVLP